MAKSLFPKLAASGAVHETWQDTPPIKRPHEIGGLLLTEADPPDMDVITFVDAVLIEHIKTGTAIVLPWELAKERGLSSVTFSDYVDELARRGLEISKLQSAAKVLDQDFAKSQAEDKAKALEFFELMKREWQVTDKQVSDLIDSNSIYLLVEIILAHVDTTRARMKAVKRHASTNRARNFVLNEWARHKIAYSGNKSAFARDYVRRVKNEHDLTVTEKQMREVWLSDTPLASKPAG